MEHIKTFCSVHLERKDSLLTHRKRHLKVRVFDQVAEQRQPRAASPFRLVMSLPRQRTQHHSQAAHGSHIRSVLSTTTDGNFNPGMCGVLGYQELDEMLKKLKKISYHNEVADEMLAHHSSRPTKKKWFYLPSLVNSGRLAKFHQGRKKPMLHEYQRKRIICRNHPASSQSPTLH